MVLLELVVTVVFVVLGFYGVSEGVIRWVSGTKDVALARQLVGAIFVGVSFCLYRVVWVALFLFASLLHLLWIFPMQFFTLVLA